MVSMRQATDYERFQKAVSLLKEKEAGRLEKVMNKYLAEGKSFHQAFEQAWDEVMGF